MAKSKTKRKRTPKHVLKLPDLEQSTAAVLNSLTSRSSQRTYDHAIREFIEWYYSEPRLALNKTVVTWYRISLEQKQYASTTINKLLLLEEAGCRRASSSTAHEAFFRAGYMRNSTLYANQANGKMESGNYVSYALRDYQLRKPDPLQPSYGLYLGGSAMTAPSRFDLYDRHFEARLYQEAPFRSRPEDFLAFVSSYICNSKYFTDALVAAGKTVWRNSASFTATYTLRAAPGQYLSVNLGYVRGPAVMPRVADALTFATTYNVYF